MFKTTVLILASVALAVAEPPVPSNRYLPSSFPAPSSRYGAPSALSINYGAPSPSTSYGTPAFDQTEAIITPNMQYGAPRISSQYSAVGISSQYGAPRISPQYGAPRISPQYGVPQISSQYGAPNGGYARAAYDDQSAPANYNFQYDVQDGEGNDFGHAEARHEDQAQGKYSVLLPDGRRQTVEYTADVEGYKPKISYEQTNNGYARGGYSNGGYSNGGYSNGGYSNGGYSNGGYSNGGISSSVYSNGGISNGVHSNGNGGGTSSGGYQY